jgi:transcriptional regulator with XRE-family HTH domain
MRLFATRVRRLRKAAKLSVDKAAERAGISGSFWGEVELQKKVPSLQIVVAIAKGLSVPADVLLQVDNDEDERALRKRLDVLLTKSNLQKLRLIYRLAKTVVDEP